MEGADFQLAASDALAKLGRKPKGKEVGWRQGH